MKRKRPEPSGQNSTRMRVKPARIPGWDKLDHRTVRGLLKSKQRMPFVGLRQRSTELQIRSGLSRPKSKQKTWGTSRPQQMPYSQTAKYLTLHNRAAKSLCESGRNNRRHSEWKNSVGRSVSRPLDSGMPATSSPGTLPHCLLKTEHSLRKTSGGGPLPIENAGSKSPVRGQGLWGGPPVRL